MPIVLKCTLVLQFLGGNTSICIYFLARTIERRESIRVRIDRKAEKAKEAVHRNNWHRLIVVVVFVFVVVVVASSPRVIEELLA